MEASTVIWIIVIALIVIFVILPGLHRSAVRSNRARAIRSVETKRGSKVIMMVHRQETMSFVGVPVARYIDMDDSEDILTALRLIGPDKPIDLILHTPGGLVLASVQIARAIKAHAGKVTVMVPHMAMSGGTLLALAADEIVMSPHAVLGPVDPQLGNFAAASFLRVVRDKDVNQIDDTTLMMADMSEKAQVQVREVVYELVKDKYPEEKAQELAQGMSEGRWTHDRPITFEEIRDYGHPVSDDMPPEVLRLMGLYKQPTKTSGGIVFMPDRQGAQPPAAGSESRIRFGK